MIGLGSNRLSVCRRGGMSVTQAGRGGMEWLAGGRGASWESPYSAQATAALLAQFSLEQWATIRDYGFAHPEIVGYMNAYAPEDAKIAYSLVEGIGTRWIRNDAQGNAYIDTGTKYLPGYSVETVLQIMRNLDDMNFAIGAYAAGNRYAIRSIDAGGGIWIQFGSGNVCQVGSGYGKHKVIMAETTCYVDDTAYPNSYTLSNNGNNLYLFRASGGTYPSYSQISYVKIKNGANGVRDMIPFKRNGAMGMIDLLTGTFYGNANSSGSFSESIESPS